MFDNDAKAWCDDMGKNLDDPNTIPSWCPLDNVTETDFVITDMEILDTFDCFVKDFTDTYGHPPEGHHIWLEGWRRGIRKRIAEEG